MSFLNRLFGNGFDDEKLVDSIRMAVLDDPMITDPSKLTIDSEDGVITLSGTVEKRMEKAHVESTARDALHYRGLKYERIVDSITIGTKEAVA